MTRRRGRASAGTPADGGAQPDALLVRRLARRLARPVFVEDLGVVRIHVGDGPRPIARVRRKVLALVCFLLARPDLAATRDEILDALWESSDPGAAANSLNQTIYYLRRTLEDRYDSRRSPHYVTYDRELVSLDSELVDSRSRRCLVLLDRCEREGEGPPPGARRDRGRSARPQRGEDRIDVAVEPVVGGKEVKSWGGEVKLIPLVQGRSTSKIIEKMAQ